MHRPSPHRRSVSLASSLFLLLPLVAAACEGLPALEAPRAPAAEPAQAVDVLHYAIDLSLAPARREIEASCTIRMQATDDGLETVALALAGLSVRSVRDGTGRELAYTREGDRLLVRLAETEFPGRPFEVVVEYGGHPVTGLWFAGRRAAGPAAHGPSQVYSHGQPEHNRGWFPCVETLSDRATSELRVTMPKDWVAFGPGRRVEAVDGPDVRTEHWQMDEEHPSYLMSVTAGDFVVKEEAWQGIPLYFAAGVLYEDWMEGTFAETDDVLGFLVDYTGVRYPYPKYSQVAVENFAWSGMENVSATTLTELALGDERGARDEPATGLIAHEAAHQWFGDLLTCADWSELWLNEGFATYLERPGCATCGTATSPPTRGPRGVRSSPPLGRTRRTSSAPSFTRAAPCVCTSCAACSATNPSAPASGPTPPRTRTARSRRTTSAARWRRCRGRSSAGSSTSGSAPAASPRSRSAGAGTHGTAWCASTCARSRAGATVPLRSSASP